MIEYHHIGKTFDGGQTFALRDLTLSVEEKELVVLFGAEGAGKSVALKLVNRLLDPSDGQIFLGGVDIAQVDRVKLRYAVGYVFSVASLFKDLDVLANASVVLQLQGWSSREQEQRARQVLDMLGLARRTFTSCVEQLTLEEKYRLIIARALAPDPGYLLFDDPLKGAPPDLRERLCSDLKSLHQQLGKTCIFATTDPSEALSFHGRIAVLEKGKLLHCGLEKQIEGESARALLNLQANKKERRLQIFRECP